jgi:hypothetical protein
MVMTNLGKYDAPFRATGVGFFNLEGINDTDTS